MGDTTARDAGEDGMTDDRWALIGRLYAYVRSLERGELPDEASRNAQLQPGDIPAHVAAPPAPEGTIYIGSAEIRPFKDPIQAHVAAPPAGETVERVANAIRRAVYPRGDAFPPSPTATIDAARAAIRVMHAAEPGPFDVQNFGDDSAAFQRAIDDAHDAALAAMPAPGDTLEGLLGDAWEIAQARRDDSGRWIVAVWRLPYSPRQLIRDGAYGAGPTIADAVRLAIEAAGEGKGDV